MILFYSDYCQHCKILLETIKRHDNNNIVKLANIDQLRSLNKPIDSKLHSVPALLLQNGKETKEYLFGKAVFDYLLLPNRGILLSGQTRDDKRTSRINNNNQENTKNTQNIAIEPIAFSLGSISAESFSMISDNDNNDHNNNQIIDNLNYNWDKIDTDNKIMDNDGLITKAESDSFKDKNKLPSIEELLKKRENDII